MFLFWWQIKTKQDFLKFIKQDGIEEAFLNDLAGECIEALDNDSFNEYGYIHKMLETVNGSENKPEILSNEEVINNVAYTFMKKFHNKL